MNIINNEYKNINQKEGMSWCPKCGGVLLWFEMIDKNHQKCKCVACSSFYVATLKQ